MEPLSDAVEGLAVKEPPEGTDRLLKVNEGGSLAKTVMIRLPVEVSEPSLTCRTMVLAPVVMEQLAAISAFTVPLVLTMLEIVRPGGTLMAVTVRLPAGLSGSLTVAMVVLNRAEPCCRKLGVG